MATQAMACPTALTDYHCNAHRGLPQQLAMHVTSATHGLQLQPKYWSNKKTKS
jgi:hypothetical protein